MSRIGVPMSLRDGGVFTNTREYLDQRSIQIIQKTMSGEDYGGEPFGVNDWYTRLGGWDLAFIHQYCNRHPVVIQWLLDHGADIDRLDGNRQTALMYAVVRRNEDEWMDNLLEKGAKINLKDQWGQTALDLAIFWDKPPFPVIRTLLRWGANVLGTRFELSHKRGIYEQAVYRLTLLIMTTPRCLLRARNVPLALLPTDILHRLMRYLL